MELKNEKKMEMAEFDIELSVSEYSKLREYGLKHIVNDDTVLINYAINKLLEKSVELLEENVKVLRKKVRDKNKE